jgi:hypothetical protein
MRCGFEAEVILVPRDLDPNAKKMELADFIDLLIEDFKDHDKSFTSHWQQMILNDVEGDNRVAQTAFILFSTFLDLRPVSAGPDLQTLIYGWL